MSLERKISDIVKDDKARIELGHLSKFGLFEMSRQRLRAPLSSQSQLTCPTCNGQGQIKDPNLVALESLRKIQSAVIVGGVSTAKVRLHPSAALILLNNKRAEIAKLEAEKDVTILIMADGRLKPDDCQFEMEMAKDAPAVAATPPTPVQKVAVSAAIASPDDDEEDDEQEEPTAKAAV